MSEWQPIETAPRNGAVIDLWLCDEGAELSEWQSIETAPRDGAVIDLWLGDERAPNCFWCADEEDPDDWPHWRQGYAEAPGCHFSIEKEPTHWMPIPEPPR